MIQGTSQLMIQSQKLEGGPRGIVHSQFEIS